MTVTIRDVEALMTRTDLSWKAKGIACAIMLKLDDFTATSTNKINLLINAGTDAQVSIRSGLRELEAAGLLKMDIVRNDPRRGSITGSSWSFVKEAIDAEN